MVKEEILPFASTSVCSKGQESCPHPHGAVLCLQQPFPGLAVEDSLLWSNL